MNSEPGMNACPAFREELGACAATSTEPAPALAAHLEECSHCRAAFRALQQAAALQTTSSAALPDPRTPANLDSWFVRALEKPSGQPRPGPASRKLSWRPLALTGAALFASLMAVLWIGFQGPSPRQPEVLPPSPLWAGQESPERSAVGSPTWLAVRDAILREGSIEAFSRQGSSRTPNTYRLKDAYSNLP